MASLDEISSERFFSVKTRMFYFNHEGTASHGWRAPSDYGIIPLAIIDD